MMIEVLGLVDLVDDADGGQFGFITSDSNTSGICHTNSNVSNTC